ncbi:MAG: prolipoprotein diacylglyceryl transferase, partial [Lachnospiraceae bacterium]|nr:prolipoprotein diacylglyceryl transferase [Lachnospiraceae bacterium]
MDINSIAFPNLGIFLENVPKNFKIGSFTIAFYGCLIALGILLGLLMASYDRKSRGMTDDAL